MVTVNPWALRAPQKQSLFDWGYLPNADDREQAAKVDGVDLRAGLELYQDTFRGELDPLAIEVHGRSLEIDGEPGEVTQRLLGRPRCDRPDYIEGKSAAAVSQAKWPDT